MSMKFVAASSQYITSSVEFATLRTTSSLSLWIKTTQVGPSASIWLNPAIIGIEQDGGANDIFWTTIGNDNKLWFSARGGATIKSASDVNDGQWHHWLITWNSSTGATQIFLDGALDGSGTSGTGVVTNTWADIGRQYNTGGYYVYYDGEVEDIRFYNRILSVDEALCLANGIDGIVYGMMRKYPLSEHAPNVAASGAGVVKDEGIVAGHCTPTNSPTWQNSILTLVRQVA